MQRTAVVLGLAVLVSFIYQLVLLRLRATVSYLLGGSCFFPLLLALLRAMGSKSLTTASGFAAASANDVVSTSGAASVEALRRKSGCMAFTVGLASLHRAVAVRYGSSRRAMMCDVVLVMDMRPNAVFDEVLALAFWRGKGLQGSRPRLPARACRGLSSISCPLQTPRGALAQRSPAFKMLLCG